MHVNLCVYLRYTMIYMYITLVFIIYKKYVHQESTKLSSFFLAKKWGVLEGFKQRKLSSCHKLKFANLYIFATRCRRTLIFQIKNSVRSNRLSLNYQRFAPSRYKDIEGLYNLSLCRIIFWEMKIDI